MRSTTFFVLATLLMGLLAVPATAATLFFDFGDSNQPSAGSNYNDIVMNGNPQPIVLPNTIDSLGGSTGIGLTVSGFFPGSNQNGTTTPGGAAGATFVTSATRDNAFTHVAAFGGQTTNPVGSLVFTGLDNSTAYDFTFFASRMGVTDNRESLYTVTGSSVGSAALDASSNADNVVSVLGIYPLAGSISVTVQAGPNNAGAGSTFAYIAALKMESVIPEPSTLGLLAVSTLGLALRRRFLS